MANTIDMQLIKDLKNKKLCEAGVARGDSILGDLSPSGVTDVFRSITNQIYENLEFRELVRSAVWIGDEKYRRRKQNGEKKCD